VKAGLAMKSDAADDSFAKHGHANGIVRSPQRIETAHHLVGRRGVAELCKECGDWLGVVHAGWPYLNRGHRNRVLR
jgi:hypothetical protein